MHIEQRSAMTLAICMSTTKISQHKTICYATVVIKIEKKIWTSYTRPIVNVTVTYCCISNLRFVLVSKWGIWPKPALEISVKNNEYYLLLKCVTSRKTAIYLYCLLFTHACKTLTRWVFLTKIQYFIGQLCLVQ